MIRVQAKATFNAWDLVKVRDVPANKGITFISWKPPDDDYCVILNTDGSKTRNPGPAAYAGVFRSTEGRQFGEFQQSLETCNSHESLETCNFKLKNKHD